MKIEWVGKASMKKMEFLCLLDMSCDAPTGAPRQRASDRRQEKDCDRSEALSVD
jgi:hypothetical protein